MKDEVQISAPRLWLVLARAHGAVASYIEHAIAAQGLCLSKFMVLEVLLHKGPLTISTIGEKVLLASASMTSAIDGLEGKGLVVRKNSPEDRRVRLVELTPAGRELISSLYAQHEKDLESVTAGLSAEERKSLYDGLKKIGFAAKHAAPAEKASRA
jgi:MarR family 2-MHQ and catechol resistance regulon transcriptional repressor